MFDINAHFYSMYPGYCKWCGYRYFPGEVLTFVDDECVCEKCVYDAEEFNIGSEFEEQLSWEHQRNTSENLQST